MGYRALFGCAALVAWVSPFAVPAVAARPLCTQVVVAPDFASSRTAYCAALVRDGTSTSVTVARTSDGGRSWRRATAAGLGVRPDDHEARLLLSTEYASDKAVYVALDTSGTFRSVDGGETFVFVDPNGSGVVAATRTVGAGPLPIARRGVLLVAKHGPAEGVNESFSIDPPLPRAPVPGTPAVDEAFVSAPDEPGTVLAFGSTGAGNAYRVAAYACTAGLSCTTPLGSLPPGQHLDRVWLSPRFGSDGVMLVRTIDHRLRTTFFRSADGGRSFAVLSAVQRLVDALYAAGGVPQSDVAGTVIAGRARLYLRLGDPAGRGSGPPAEQILASDDLGRTWRLLSFGRQPWQSGPRGTIPVSASPGTVSEPPGFVAATADRLFIAGFRGVLCSVDGGGHWAAACAR